MPEEKTSGADSTAKIVKKLTLPDGSRVGILNLDSILKEVADLKLMDTHEIKAEILQRVKECNYVPSSAENEYGVALFQEYQRKFGGPGAANGGGKTEIHKHSGG